MKKGNKIGLLKCKAGKGMFEGEKIVSYKINDKINSAIVYEECVIDKNKLKVDIYEKKGDKLLIGIPGETFSTSRKIWVPQEIIEIRKIEGMQ